MSFIIKYNVFYKCIINVTTTVINACKKFICLWSIGANFFLYVRLLTRESTLLFTQSKQTLTGRKGRERESNTVKDARSLNR